MHRKPTTRYRAKTTHQMNNTALTVGPRDRPCAHGVASTSGYVLRESSMSPSMISSAGSGRPYRNRGSGNCARHSVMVLSGISPAHGTGQHAQSAVRHQQFAPV